MYLATVFIYMAPTIISGATSTASAIMSAGQRP